MAYLIGQIIGGFIIMGILTRILFGLLKRKGGNSALIWSYVVTTLLVIAVTPFTMGLYTGLLRYIPVLMIWLLYDIIRGKHRISA